MNKRRGFLRLTLVLSIVVGIIIPFYMKEAFEAFRDTICEAEEKVYESTDPPKYPPSPPSEWLQPPIGRHLVQPPVEPVPPPKITFTTLTPSNGVVRSTRKVMFKCNNSFSLLSDKQEGLRLNKIFEDNLGKVAVGKSEGAYITYCYTMLGKKNVIDWKGFIGMGITSFILVWFIYAFIRWVIIAFVIGGFKNK
jgi:hypothetical protein